MGNEVGNGFAGSSVHGRARPQSGCRWGLRSHLRFGVLFPSPWLLAKFSSLQVWGWSPHILEAAHRFPPNGSLHHVQTEGYLEFLFPWTLAWKTVYFRMRRNWFLLDLISDWIWHLVNIKGLYAEYMAFCEAISGKENGLLLIYNLSQVGRTSRALEQLLLSGGLMSCVSS